MKTIQTLLSCLVLGAVMIGCKTDTPPVNPTASNDPAGLGTPQQRLEALKANTTMPEALKQRKMKILQDEIKGQNSTPGKG